MDNETKFTPGIIKSPALYESVDLVVNINKPIVERWVSQGKSLDEAIEKTFGGALKSPRTADQDKKLIEQAIELIKSKK